MRPNCDCMHAHRATKWIGDDTVPRSKHKQYVTKAIAGSLRQDTSIFMVIGQLVSWQIFKYDTIAEFNVESKADYSALSSTRSQEKKLKQTTPVPLWYSTGLNPWRQSGRNEWLWRKGFVKEMSFKSGVKGQGSDRWWERRWWLWSGDMQDVVNQEESEHNEVDGMKKGADSTGEVIVTTRLAPLIATPRLPWDSCNMWTTLARRVAVNSV